MERQITLLNQIIGNNEIKRKVNTNIECDYSSKHFPAEKLLEDNDHHFDNCMVIIEANNTW